MKKNKIIGFIGLSHLSLSYSLASAKKGYQIIMYDFNDDLMSKFEIMPQEDASRRMAIIDVDCWNGVIGPRQKQIVNITLKSEILKQLKASLVVVVFFIQFDYVYTFYLFFFFLPFT